MKHFHALGVFLTSSRFVLLAGTVCVFLVLSQRKPDAAPSYTATLTQGDALGSQPVHPRQECQAMFTIDKGSEHGSTWSSDVPYTKLSHELPPLLAASTLVVNTTSDSAFAAVYSGTRLQLLDGSVPYLPCQVRQYNATDVGRCGAARAARGGKTWVAFVGDSNQRQKTHSFLDFLPPDLVYTYYLGKKEVTLEDFTYAVAHHKHRPPTFDIIGRRSSGRRTWSNPQSDSGDTDDPPPAAAEAGEPEGVWRGRPEALAPGNPDESLLEEDISLEDVELRVTLVWAPAASVRDPDFMESNIRRPKVTKLAEWAMAQVIPDVIIIGLGTWLLLMREYHDELVPFTELETLTRPLVKPLTTLAGRTHLLFWSQSRYRWFNFEGEIDPVKEGNHREFWKQTLYLNQFRDAIPLMDAWLWGILRYHLTVFLANTCKSTGAWQWDSTLPFNLANIQECLLLKNARIFNDPVYRDKWWNCVDVHHSSYETNSVEIQMILNLLCNPHLLPPTTTDQQYCCSGKQSSSVTHT